MELDPTRADLAESLRRTLDAAHDTALRAVGEADSRAGRVERAARAQSRRAADAVAAAAEELATLAAALRESGADASAEPPPKPKPDPLVRLSAEIARERLEPEPVEPEPVEPEPVEPAPRAADPRPRARTSRRASLRDSPIVSMLQDSSAPREPAGESESAPSPEPVRPPEPSEPVVVRARPGLAETWRRRISVR